MIEALLGRTIEGRDGRLLDHACRPVRSAPYPAVVPEAGLQTDGRLYTGLTPRDWRLLDAFEGELYRRRRAEVVLGAERCEATIYAPREALLERLGPGLWTPARCRTSQLRRYAAICRALRRRFERR